MSSTSYEQVCAAHRWDVPARYNIAYDVCDKHPRDKLAMVWESFDGSYRELVWGELQDLANQAAHVLSELGVERGDRVDLLWRLEAGRDLALDVGAVRRRLDSPSPLGLGREARRHGRGQRAALRRLGCADARPGGRHA